MSDFLQDAFNSGEICEEALSRPDIAQAAKIVRWGLNGTFMVQGGWRRRKGTWFVAVPKAGAGDYALVPFSRASGQSVILELGYTSGAGYGRVYGLDRARVGTVEFSTPFTQDELIGGLSPLQTGDAEIFYRRNCKQPHVVQRLGPTSWQCVAFGCRNGPFLAEETGDGSLLGIGGSGLSASPGIFAAGDTGGLIRIKAEGGYTQAEGWRADWDKPQNSEIAYNSGNYYQAESAVTKKTGFLAPIHESGTRSDGNAGASNWGVAWTYLHDGSTTGVLGAFSSSTSIGVTWLGGLCTPTSSTTTYYALGAYNDHYGWPSMAACIREQRIVTGGTLANPDTLDLTRTNGWDLNGADYKPGMGSGLVVADDALRLTVGGNGARLMWAVDRDGLFVATEDALYAVTGAGLGLPLKPTDGAVVAEVAGGGSSTVLPAKTPKTLLYTPRSRRALLEISGTAGDYSVNEISLLFQHITGLGVAQVLYMAAPWHQFVLRLDDGSVAFVSYNRDQNVLGAARQDFGGRVFTSAVVPGTDGEDQLWLGVERDGVRSTEVMASYYEPMFLDSAQFYTGAATNTLSGLGRFEGLAVSALGDGVWHPALPVVSGVTHLLDEATAAYVVVGYDFRSRLELMPLGESHESWADMKVNAARAKISARFTHYEMGTTAGDVGEEGQDSRIERTVNKGAGGRWIEKRVTTKSPLIGRTDYDKRVFVQTSSPFDLVVYSVKVETAT